MAWKLREEERRAVLALDGPSRYNYFIKKAADENCVWSLWQNGWVLAEDADSRPVVPVWPHPQFAEICAAGVWVGHEPRQIDMEAWLDRWLPGIQRDGRLVAIFPAASDEGVIVEPGRLAEDLAEELQNYE